MTAVTASALALHDAVTRLVPGRGSNAITDHDATELRWVCPPSPHTVANPSRT